MAEEPLQDRVDRLSGRPLRQPDQRSCGAAVLVVARALEHPSYAGLLDDPRAFSAAVLGVHRQVTSPVDTRGRAQLPWPQALGTPPWAVARQRAGDTGIPHHTHLHRFGPAAAFDRIAAASAATPVPFYVGSRLLPRHVVLALGSEGERLACYEPSSGTVVGVDRAAFATGRLGLGRWGVVWFSVQPAARRTRA